MTLNAASELQFSSPAGEANYRAARRRYPAQAIVDLATLRDNMAHLVDVVGGPQNALYPACGDADAVNGR